MLSAQDLKLTFNPGTPIETRALRGLSLEIPDGQFVAVIGSNGAGKSTFLNAVSGDQRVDSGRIAIDGTDVTRQPACFDQPQNFAWRQALLKHLLLNPAKIT